MRFYLTPPPSFLHCLAYVEGGWGYCEYPYWEDGKGLVDTREKRSKGRTPSSWAYCLRSEQAMFVSRQGRAKNDGRLCFGGRESHESPNTDVSLLQVAELSSPSGRPLQSESTLGAFRRKADC